MDTRTKVVPLADWSAQPGEEWTLVAGVFDPFTLEVANAVTRHRRPGAKLAVAIAGGADTLLNREARAILIAALREVDIVFVEDVSPVMERASHLGVAISLADERAGDRERSGDFFQFVIRRQASANSGSTKESNE